MLERGRRGFNGIGVASGRTGEVGLLCVAVRLLNDSCIYITEPSLCELLIKYKTLDGKVVAKVSRAALVGAWVLDSSSCC